MKFIGRTFFPGSVVRPLKMNEIQIRNNAQPKDTGQLPVEINGFLPDKDRHLNNCVWFKQLVTDSDSCKVKYTMFKTSNRVHRLNIYYYIHRKRSQSLGL